MQGYIYGSADSRYFESKVALMNLHILPLYLQFKRLVIKY
jgi:hypothetical protein